ncbi:MAG TPA: glycerol-3-phosphate 1-O-acyltransferase PlsY [Acetobacteraceae bacterium]|nr:glycerol-3-phosphate 1-O-acyltransferase PlsY [Acetobacteraceae bacterium]
MIAGLALALIVGYLIGSVPFGLLITRAAGLGDIRAIGSGSIGTTNVLRTGRKELAAATLLLDAAKGAVPVLLAARLLGPLPALTAGLGAIVGHVAPVWLRFRGGKGVATGFGVLLAAAWPVGLFSLLVWLAVAAVGRFSSLAGLAAFAAAPVFAAVLGETRTAVFALLLAAIVFLRHRENILRLLAGTEPRIGAGK